MECRLPEILMANAFLPRLKHCFPELLNRPWPHDARDARAVQLRVDVIDFSPLFRHGSRAGRG